MNSLLIFILLPFVLLLIILQIRYKNKIQPHLRIMGDTVFYTYFPNEKYKYGYWILLGMQIIILAFMLYNINLKEIDFSDSLTISIIVIIGIILIPIGFMVLFSKNNEK